MKKLSSQAIGTFVIMFAFSLISYVQPVAAKVIMQEKGAIVIDQKETIDDDLFVAGESVTLHGKVNGDVFVGAVNARISGDIAGGLFVGSGDLTLTGAKIGGSLVVGSGNVVIDETTTIAGSLIVGAGNIQNSGSIMRNAMIGAGSIFQNGSVGKEARLGAGSIELGPRNKIAGDFTYALGDEQSNLITSPSSSVSGSTSRFVEPEQTRKDIAKAKEDFAQFGRFFGKAWLLFSFVSSILIGFIFLKLFPKTMLNLAGHIAAAPLKSLGIGLLMVVAVIPVLLAISFTIIGIPLAGLLLLVFWVDIHVAKLIAAYALGKLVSEMANLTKPSIYLVFFIGITLFYMLRLLPGLGWIASVAFTWVGLGAIWSYFTSHLKNL